MPMKMARSAPSTTVQDARDAGSRLYLASGLQEGRKSPNIHARSGVIRGIPIMLLLFGLAILRHNRREIVSFGVTSHPEWLGDEGVKYAQA